MTATETDTISNDTWAAEMAQLRSRYKAVREPILAALNLLMQDPNITDDDAKARASMRGVRITAASINGARNLLAKRDTVATADAPARPAAATARRVRPATPEIDAEGPIRQVVGKLQSQGTAEAERLREAMRKAVAMLTAAIG